MVSVTITVIDCNERGSYVEWTGELGWLSLPPENADWFHCGEWAGELIDRVSYNHGTKPSHNIEIHTMAEVLEHLVVQHGFTDFRRSPNGTTRNAP